MSKKKGSEVQKSDSTEDFSLDQVLENLPEEKQAEVVQLLVQQSAFFAGPLPPPEVLHGYEEILPGSADRVVQLAENEQQARQRDNRHILGNDSFRIAGSVVVSLALIAAGVFCGYIDQPWLGGVLGTSGTFAGIMGVMFPKKKD